MNFHEVRQRVFEKTPVFKRIIETSGKMSLNAYFSGSIQAPCLVLEERKNELLHVVEDLLCPLIGVDSAAEARNELAERYAVSTADHHGPLAHPFFFSCHVAQAAALAQSTYRYLFVFSCAGISLNNSSFPRGLLFHDDNLALVRAPFFSLKHRRESVYALRSYTKEGVKEIVGHVNRAQLVPIFRDRLLTAVGEIYASEQVLSMVRYADQVTATNFALWKKLPGQLAKNFISLSQEDIVVDLLVRYHLGHGTLLEKMFIEPEMLSAFETCFNGVTGAFLAEKKHGTLLVWALREGERMALWRSGNELVSEDGTYRIELTTECLRAAFIQKKLLPSMALSFVVLSFYYGLTCGGGFSQVNYLTDMKHAYLRFLEFVHASPEEKSVVSRSETERLTADISHIFLEKHNQRVSATPLDFIACENTDTESRLKELSESCTLSEAIDQLIPELYRILYRTPLSVCAPKFSFPSTLYA